MVTKKQFWWLIIANLLFILSIMSWIDILYFKLNQKIETQNEMIGIMCDWIDYVQEIERYQFDLSNYGQ